jgi:alanyl-tRNA synthetase
VRVCHQAGLEASAWAEASKEVVRLYSSAYPELEQRSAEITEQLDAELHRFQKTLVRGTARIEGRARLCLGDTVSANLLISTVQYGLARSGWATILVSPV